MNEDFIWLVFIWTGVRQWPTDLSTMSGRPSLERPVPLLRLAQDCPVSSFFRLKLISSLEAKFIIFYLVN